MFSHIRQVRRECSDVCSNSYDLQIPLVCFIQRCQNTMSCSYHHLAEDTSTRFLDPLIINYDHSINFLAYKNWSSLLLVLERIQQFKTSTGSNISYIILVSWIYTVNSTSLQLHNAQVSMCNKLLQWICHRGQHSKQFDNVILIIPSCEIINTIMHLSNLHRI